MFVAPSDYIFVLICVKSSPTKWKFYLFVKKKNLYVGLFLQGAVKTTVAHTERVSSGRRPSVEARWFAPATEQQAFSVKPNLKVSERLACAFSEFYLISCK